MGATSEGLGLDTIVHGTPGSLFKGAAKSGSFSSKLLGTVPADALVYLRSLARVPVKVFVDQARVRPVDQPMLVADSSKLRAAVGWEPQYGIQATLADMLEWCRKAIG